MIFSTEDNTALSFTRQCKDIIKAT